MNTTRTVAPSHPPCTPAQQAGAIAREAARGWVGLGAIWSVRAQYRARGPAEYRDEARPRWSPGTEEGRKGGPTRTRARACVGAPDVISSRRLLAARARLSPCPGAGLGELSGSVRPRVVRERRCWDGTYALPGRLRPSCSQPARDDVRAAPRPLRGAGGRLSTTTFLTKYSQSRSRLPCFSTFIQAQPDLSPFFFDDLLACCCCCR